VLSTGTKKTTKENLQGKNRRKDKKIKMKMEDKNMIKKEKIAK
jgi:hypothetical protein